jgi:alpha-glucosidase (family GH31 glycosyl hydrolase)
MHRSTQIAVASLLCAGLGATAWAGGNVSRLEVHGNLIRLGAGTDVVEVQVCDPGVLRVDYLPQGLSSPATDMADPQATWPRGRVGSRDLSGDPIVLRTGKMVVKIGKKPLTLAVFDASGERPLLRQLGADGLNRDGLNLAYPAGANFYGLHGFDAFEESPEGILRNQGGRIQTPVQGNVSAPFLWSTSGFGVLVDSDHGAFSLNAADHRLGFSGNGRKDLAFYVLAGAPRDIMASLAKVSGAPALFPKWAMGFTNSQWGIDESEFRKIVDRYRQKHIPIDNFTFDFDWKAWGDDHYGDWRWNEKNFPDGPSGKLKTDMAALGIHLTGILKPRIHSETEQGRYATDHGFWWPGESLGLDYFSKKPIRNLNFSIPACRQWYALHLVPAFDSGVCGWWNDEADDLSDRDGVPGGMSATAGAYTFQGSGSDLWGTSDQFNFSYQSLDRDGAIVARVTSQEWTHNWAKTGLMLRESLADNSPYVALLLTPKAGFGMQWRSLAGASTDHGAGVAANPWPNNWIKLVREGDRFTGYRSADGIHWTEVGHAKANLGPKLYAGVVVCSHNNGALCAVTVDHLDLGSPTLALRNADVGGFIGGISARWEFKDMQQAIYEGQRARTGQRVWSLNRNFVLGSQRYAYGLWSGDIATGFESMARQRERMLSAINVGETKWGMDSGGFYGTPDPENYARWIEFSAFVPVFRVHGTHNEKRQPWVYGPKAEAAAKRAAQLRYRLIPYIYSYERAAHDNGVGLVRPLIFDHPGDSRVANDVEAWMFGDSLLVAPVVEAGQAVKPVYLPQGRWIDYFKGTRYAGGETIQVPLDKEHWQDIPLFIKEGSILVSQGDVDYVGERPLATLSVDVFPSKTAATFNYYDDDGETYAYEKGVEFEQAIGAVEKAGAVQVDLGNRTGTYQPALKQYLIQVHGTAAAKVTLNGRAYPKSDLPSLQSGSSEGWADSQDLYGPVTVLRVAAGVGAKIRLN